MGSLPAGDADGTPDVKNIVDLGVGRQHGREASRCEAPGGDDDPDSHCGRGPPPRLDRGFESNRSLRFSEKRRFRREFTVGRLREAIYWALEEPHRSDYGGEYLVFARCVGALIIALVILSIVCYVMETMPQFADTPKGVWKAAEGISTGMFTIEYLLRFWVCDLFGASAISWMLRPLNICEALATSPMYAELLLGSSEVKFLRVLRVVRLFKLGRYSHGVKLMAAALKNSFGALNILVLLFFLGVVAFASAVYFSEKLSCPAFADGTDAGLVDFQRYVAECAQAANGLSPSFGTCCEYQCRGSPSEDPTAFNLCTYDWDEATAPAGDTSATWRVSAMHEQQFKSVIHGMWWACTTMSTVGYGDMYPKHWLSKVVACIAMLSGMLIIAMPFAIVGAKFGEAVVSYEDPEEMLAAERLRRIKRMKKSKTLSPRSLSRLMSFAKKCGEGDGIPGCQQSFADAADLVRQFEHYRNEVQESLELKRKILKVQALRDNLWTSVEHSIATLAYEGLLSFEKKALVQPQWVSNQDKGGKALVELSCGVFHRESYTRKLAIRLTTFWLFDWVVLGAIVANGTLLALHDYYPGSSTRLWNRLSLTLEPWFLGMFTFECVAKVIAQGFVFHEKAYLRDAWNWIDFVVVVTGLASIPFGDGMSKLAILRTLRVLRVLRTLSMLPGLRKLVNTIIVSLPGLKDVIIMALFLMTIFGILGLFFFGGVMHRLCRVTPQPLHFVASVPKDGSCAGWCFDNSTIVSYVGTATVDSAAVFAAFCAPEPDCANAVAARRDYYMWPVEPSQDRFCGAYDCRPLERDSPEVADWNFGLEGASLISRVLEPLGAFQAADGHVHTTCGSPFPEDHYGPEKLNPSLGGVVLDNFEREVFSETFNWGLTQYDNLGAAFLVIFQCVTLEGWVDIMYMLQDASSSALGFIYFLSLVVLGSFFLLNVTLAIVWDAFAAVQDKKERAQQRRLEAEEKVARVAARQRAKSEQSGPKLVGEIGDMLQAVGTESTCSTQAYMRGSASNAFGKVLTYQREKQSTEDILAMPHTRSTIRLARGMARNPYWNAFVMLFIAMNVVTLAMDSYKTWPLVDTAIIDGLNVTFNVIFAVEFIVLHIALGPVNYWFDATLVFDGLIVLLSLTEIVYSISSDDAAASGVSALRAFRLLRIFKLAKKFESMKVLLRASFETILGMREFVLLLVIIIVVFALIGQSVFAGTFLFDLEGDGSVLRPRGWSASTAASTPEWTVEEFEQRCPRKEPPYLEGRAPACVPRSHFDSFLWSFITIFQILTGENWNAVMYDGMKAIGPGAIVFFVLVIMIGQLVILNLFLAILMTNFEYNQIRIIETFRSTMKKRQRSRPMWLSVLNMDWKRWFGIGRRPSDPNDGPSPETVAPAQSLSHGDGSPEAPVASREGDPECEDVSNRGTCHDRGPDVENSDFDVPGCVPDNESSCIALSTSCTLRSVAQPNHFVQDGESRSEASAASAVSSFVVREASPEPPPDQHFLCRAGSAARMACLKLVSGPWFDRGILVCIVLSSALMCRQNPLADPRSLEQRLLAGANIFFTVIFAFEMCVKIIALGLICGRGAYLRTSWNVMDAVIVTVSLLDVLGPGEDLVFVQVFRVARMLRPLRLISRNKNLKIVVRTIGDSLPELRDLLLFTLMFFLIFGLLGVSWFKGSFYRCLDAHLEDQAFVFPDGHEGGVTQLCIPRAPSGASGTAASMSFVQAATADGDCPTSGAAWAGGWEIYARPSDDTPICEVHCDGQHSAAHPFCLNTHPWGYNVMRCTDCQATFCPSAAAEPGLYEACESRCASHHWFCIDGNSECRRQCVASCLCPEECNGLAHDAALCIEQGGRWVNMNQNFDDLLRAMISLFEISTTEGWVDVMLAGVDARGPMRQPRRDNNELAVFLFVAFILVGSFFVLNLCVGVIIDNYHKQKERRGTVLVTDAQSQWMSFQKALYAKRTFFPQTNLHKLSATRCHLYRICSSRAFDNSIMACIVLNTIVLGMSWHPRPGAPHQEVITTLNVAFVFVFNLEAFLKLSAYRWNYFREAWNVYDFCCIGVGDIFTLLQAFAPPSMVDSLGAAVSVFRIFRLARLFRLLRFLKGLNQLFFAFVLSLPKLFNVAVLMCLLIYLYAVLGVSLFAKVHFLDAHNEAANFRTFFKAYSVLVRSMTGEEWNEIMHDLSKSQFFFESYIDVKCVPVMSITGSNFGQYDVNPHDHYVDEVLGEGLAHECGDYGFSALYFVTYTIIVSFVILNLFIAVIFEGFEESSRAEITELLETSVDVWRRYDPCNTMLISLDRAFDFIDEVMEQLWHRHSKDGRHWHLFERWVQGAPDGFRGYEGNKWCLYNLRYIRLNGLSVTEDNQVRFVVAVKAVVRRIICQGGLASQDSHRGEHMQRLRELEELDNQLLMDTAAQAPRRELLKLRADEEMQAQAINRLLGTRIGVVPPRPLRATRSIALQAVMTLRRIGSFPAEEEAAWTSEYLLLERVASAKIQRRFKDVLERHARRRRVGLTHRAPSKRVGWPAAGA